MIDFLNSDRESSELILVWYIDIEKKERKVLE